MGKDGVDFAGVPSSAWCFETDLRMLLEEMNGEHLRVKALERPDSTIQSPDCTVDGPVLHSGCSDRLSAVLSTSTLICTANCQYRNA